MPPLRTLLAPSLAVLAVAAFSFVTACGEGTATPAGVADGSSDASSSRTDAEPDAPDKDSGVHTDAGGDASKEASADLAACRALCAAATTMACTFRRDGVVNATGTWENPSATASGCIGIAKVDGDDEIAPIELDCVKGEICVNEGAKRHCYPGEFDAKQFTYEIPSDKKRNSCTLP